MASRVVLVTGSSGLVGTALRTAAEAANAPDTRYIWLSSKECDLEDALATANLFARERPTHVFHLAAHVCGHVANT